MRNPLELLEWPQVLEKIKAYCLTPYAVSLWENTPFLDDEDAIRKHLDEVDDLKTILLRFGDPVIGSNDISDIRHPLAVANKGASLSTETLGKILKTLNASAKLIRHIIKSAEKCPPSDAAKSLTTPINLPEETLDFLKDYVTEDGDLLSSASPELERLREKLARDNQAVQQQLRKILHNPHYAQALQDAIITERDGRYVLPVKVEFKTTIPGIIHAGSSSGATLFIEPQGVVEANNTLQITQEAMNREVQRILAEVSETLGKTTPELIVFLEQVGEVDKRLAGAQFSKLLHMEKPQVLAAGTQWMDLKQVRHPLLALTLKNKIVANDIRLGRRDGGDVRTLVITGPNTGGKTVLLKTIGLCALLLRAGLHLPVKEGSAMSVFNPVLADIGDQQDLSRNLSTFSAHLENLKQFVHPQTDLNSGLVLIDEIAAGTDPAEGAALAKAILAALYGKGAVTLVTTHLGELKLETHHQEGYLNASVAFDPENLSPTYQVMMGVPGASHAITIAERLGFEPEIIRNARNALSAPVKDSAALLEEFELKNRKLAEETETVETLRKSIQQSEEQLKRELSQFQESKRKMLQDYQASLKGRVHQLDAELKSLRKEAETADADHLPDVQGKTKRLGRKADSLFGEVSGKLAEESPPLDPKSLKEGDTVRSRKMNLTGTVLKLSDNEATIQSGALKVTVPYADLEKAGGGGKARKKKKPPIFQSRVLTASDKTPERECDVRGMRGEEALLKVSKFLDDASLSGLDIVGIIHGQGTGILKKLIRESLDSSPYVKTHHPAEATDGGDGKTVVILGN